MSTERVERLRQRLLEARPRVEADRAVILTEALRGTEGEDRYARRARGLDRIFREMPLWIREDEWIVGSKAEEPLGSPLYPEFNSAWIVRELDTLPERFETAFQISPETRDRIRGILPFWEGRTVGDRIGASAPPESLEAVEEGIFFHYYLNRSIGHITCDYEKLLQRGIRGIRHEIRVAEANLRGSGWGVERQRAFLRGLLVVGDALVAFARRHGDLAEEQALRCPDPVRRAELEEIARICRKVPEHPAETFHEALQSFWFLHLGLNLESNAYAISPGRFDQYMAPFLLRDRERGLGDPEREQELLECLWLKFAELTVVKEGGTAKASNTYADFQNLNVGGLRPDGSDGVNPVSWMCLEAQASLRLPQPQLSCLISRKTPEAFLLRACEVVRLGTGMPALFNADEITLSLLEKGKTLQDARGGGVNGCVEVVAQGCDHNASSGYVNLAKCLEMTLNRGQSLTSGRQWGDQTPDLSCLSRMEDLQEAFRVQMESMVTLKHRYDTAAREAFAEVCPALLTSLVMGDCIASGKDFHEGGARYNQPMMCGVGTGTVADSLAALDEWVFRRREVSLPSLVEALRRDFEGQEELRELLWNRSPKWGNDREEADRYATWLVSTFCGILEGFANQEGQRYAANMIPTTTHLPFGEKTAATPDGRRAGQPLSEGISPVQGKDLAGPAGVIRSMGKLDHARTSGTLLNLKFSPQTLEGGSALRKFAGLVRAYFDQGGHHMQFNVVSRETLLDAQAHPERHRSLLIRVAGYSDYFVMLSRDVQDEVLSRTEHTVGA